MKLLRLVTAYFKPIPPECWRSWRIDMGGICVSTHGWTEDGDRLRLVLGAEIDLREWPTLSEARLVQIPAEERRAAESALESAANFVSIAEECQRSISSPTPCVAFLPEDDEARTWLESSNGLELNPVAYGRACVDLSIDKLQAAISDRLDGLALLAEALAHDHATGKLHEFMRVFERAFTLASRKLVTPLADFLRGAPGGFSPSEVSEWIKDIRDPATHADRRSRFLLEADVRPAIPRMQTAAYDVLLNKEQWRSPCTARRDVWHPQCWVGPDLGIDVVQGTDMTVKWQLLDDVGRYPRDLSANIEQLPDGWWCKRASQPSR